jgi:Ni,Fe-hydrogenase I cytochrome b subunit
MRTVYVLAAATTLLFAAMALYTSPLEPSIPAIQFTFTESAFNSVLNAWSPADVTRFKTHFAIDFPFLACYGALGYLLSTRTGLFRNVAQRTKSLLAVSLPVAAAADAIENALHLYFLYGPAPVAQALYCAAGVAASIKWVLIVIFVCCSGYALRKNRG